MSKEESIQEAIRLVQECNYSRRKAASSTGISPNTLKRRLNGSIPREEYLERTKKITTSEELILENMIIALIQQGEHVKSSSLRLLVALYIKAKMAPINIDESPADSTELELVPKGWCARFMKRSKNLAVNQGLTEIKDKNKVEDISAIPTPPAFATLLKPPTDANESLADTQKHIVDNASSLLLGYRLDFEHIKNMSTKKEVDNAQLRNCLDSMSEIFNQVAMLASVLNLTSRVNSDLLSKSSDEMEDSQKACTPSNNSHCSKHADIVNSDEQPTPPDYRSPSSSSLSETPSSSSRESRKRHSSVADHKPLKKRCSEEPSFCWKDMNDMLVQDMTKNTSLDSLPSSNSPFTPMLLPNPMQEMKEEKSNYFHCSAQLSPSSSTSPSDYNAMMLENTGMPSQVNLYAANELTPSIASSTSLSAQSDVLNNNTYTLAYTSGELMNGLSNSTPALNMYDGMMPLQTVGNEMDFRIVSAAAGDPMLVYN